MGTIHVMTPNELENLPDGTVVWQEANLETINSEDYPRLMPMVMYKGIIANYKYYLYPDELRAADDIQMRVRYWNYRPTIETMDKTTWVICKDWME